MPLDRVVVAVVSQGAALRSLRMLRVMSLFRLLKLFRLIKFSKLMMKLEQKLEVSPQALQVRLMSHPSCTEAHLLRVLGPSRVLSVGVDRHEFVSIRDCAPPFTACMCR
jgi:hypothetical protein